MPDLTNPELREELAKASYYRERGEDMAIDRETCLDSEAEYFCIQWEQLSEFAQRPYRTAVAFTLDHVQELVGVG